MRALRDFPREGQTSNPINKVIHSVMLITSAFVFLSACAVFH